MTDKTLRYGNDGIARLTAMVALPGTVGTAFISRPAITEVQVNGSIAVALDPPMRIKRGQRLAAISLPVGDGTTRWQLGRYSRKGKLKEVRDL